MSIADIIIIIILLSIMIPIIYFSFIKKKNKCSICPYSKSCNKDSCKNN